MSAKNALVRDAFSHPTAAQDLQDGAWRVNIGSPLPQPHQCIDGGVSGHGLAQFDILPGTLASWIGRGRGDLGELFGLRARALKAYTGFRKL